MSGSHHQLQLLLGSYVLGGLHADDRHRLEEHLHSCAECTAELSQFAVVPGLLQLAAVNGVNSEPPTPPEDALPRLLAAVKARRRRRWQRAMLAVAATVLTLAGTAGGLWLVGRGAEPVPSSPLVAASAPSTPVSQSPSGQVVLEPKTWGTQIRLTMYYVGDGTGSLSAFAVSSDGREERAANWQTPPDGKCYVIGATSITRDELTRIEIRTSDGITVLHADG